MPKLCIAVVRRAMPPEAGNQVFCFVIFTETHSRQAGAGCDAKSDAERQSVDHLVYEQVKKMTS
jgi:hypothetical protein